MSAPHLALSTQPALEVEIPVTASPREPQAPVMPGILSERWPTLARALGCYQQNTAENFTRLAYDRVSAGIIRLDERQLLAHEAEQLGIRPFDAQLLIACAIRQWALDHAYDATPSYEAPALSFEYRSWHQAWVRVALILFTAVILDGIIIWKWLS
jgi:hypothetical protein